MNLLRRWHLSGISQGAALPLASSFWMPGSGAHLPLHLEGIVSLAMGEAKGRVMNFVLTFANL